MTPFDVLSIRNWNKYSWYRNLNLNSGEGVYLRACFFLSSYLNLGQMSSLFISCTQNKELCDFLEKSASAGVADPFILLFHDGAPHNYNVDVYGIVCEAISVPTRSSVSTFSRLPQDMYLRVDFIPREFHREHVPIEGLGDLVPPVLSIDTSAWLHYRTLLSSLDEDT